MRVPLFQVQVLKVGVPGCGVQTLRSSFRMGRRREHESLSLGTGVNPESRIYSKEMREEEREGHVCVHPCEEAWGGVVEYE